jgi:hypothetical protein
MGRTNPHLSASATQIYPTQPAMTSSSSPSSSPPSSNYASRSSPSSIHHLTHDYSPSSPYTDTAGARNTTTSAATTGPGRPKAHWIRILDLARLILTLLAIAAAAAVVGCSAHTLRVYNAMTLADGFAIPALWPGSLDLRPTKAELVGGAVVLSVAMLYVLVGVVPVVSLRYLPLLVSGFCKSGELSKSSD